MLTGCCLIISGHMPAIPITQDFTFLSQPHLTFTASLLLPIFRVVSAFCDTDVSQNAEIIQKILRSASALEIAVFITDFTFCQ